ncbi:MAG TPA: ComEC/Rec2 family competence protein [Acidimicrobiia bacterium]|nr:ComEC/Rec2 family competence protein [Acidimicrobiia bacterium]
MTVIARAALAGGLGSWAGVMGWWWFPVVVVVSLRLGSIGRVERLTCVALFALGLTVGHFESRPPEPIPRGPVTVDGRVEIDFGGRWGWSGMVATPAGSVLVRADTAPETDRLVIRGVSDGVPRQLFGRWLSATIDAEELTASASDSIHESAASRLRDRIIVEIEPARGDARGLLVGFLIGDTHGVSPIVSEEMRRAGLSHLVAVSGSNVALFLVGLVVVAAPLAIHPVGRIVVVLNGLVVFGSLTRWEPSVVRASAMAGLVAIGRFVGVPLEPVTALAVASGGTVLIAPPMARSVGFQLSVLATAGLMIGARWWPGRGRIGALLSATVAAQLAVAPLLLAVFGSVPLLSPVANLVGIPLVMVATSLAGVGAFLGVDWLISLAELCAEAFIVVARVAAPWPQLGLVGFTVVALAGVVAARFRRLRPALVIVAAVILGLGVLETDRAPHTGIIVFDVGQGDSTLVRLAGFTVLVDGGPDPVELAFRLRQYGVTRVDLAVVTHVHEDHAAGLTGLFGRFPIGAVWAAFEPHETASSRALLAGAGDRGVVVDRPVVGDTITIGDDTIEVLGPRRRYAGPNDQSVVLLVTIDGVRILLSGDIEEVAQDEIDVPEVVVLKVPHQGAGTSRPDWLAAHAGRLAVVSVGENTFGHPVAWVLETLREAGSTVFRTDEVGDVIVDFDGESGVSVRTSGR